ncbi:MAG TPA: ubiquinone/menaquinone biosynthesis methyltransferase [Actinomycetota bacterium]|nr:ubiquinone/menaquinone biosynthesis methyltransferase [Actinomycetota bacterium]
MRDEGLPQGKEKARRVRDMFDAIAGRYDLVNRVMTFGMDVGWRRRAVRELRLPGGALVADLACGTGDLCRELSRDGYRAVGFDFSLGMLAKATTDVPLAQADVLRLPLADRSIDGATCGFALRNLVDLDAFFAEIARVVRAGGRISLLEASQPDGPLMRAGHAVYFRRMVPMIGGVLSDREAYAYLPKSMAYLPPVTEMVTALRDAGFTDAVRVRLSGGIAQVLAGTRA